MITNHIYCILLIRSKLMKSDCTQEKEIAWGYDYQYVGIIEAILKILNHMHLLLKSLALKQLALHILWNYHRIVSIPASRRKTQLLLYL